MLTMIAKGVLLLILAVSGILSNNARQLHNDQSMGVRHKRDTDTLYLKEVKANPSFASNHGGQMIVFSGLDPTPATHDGHATARIVCTFGKYDGINSKHNRTTMGKAATGDLLDKVHCVTPVLLDDTGMIHVKIEVIPKDGMESQTYTSILYIVHVPNRLNELKVQHDEDGDLVVDWDPKYFAPVPNDKQIIRVYELFMNLESKTMEAVDMGIFHRGQPSLDNDIIDTTISMADEDESGSGSGSGAPEADTLEPTLWFGVLVDADHATRPGNWDEDRNKQAVVSELSKTSDTLRELFNPEVGEWLNSESNLRSKRQVMVSRHLARDVLINGKPARWHVQRHMCELHLTQKGVCPKDTMLKLLACPPMAATAKVDGRFFQYPVNWKNDVTEAHVCYVSIPVKTGDVDERRVKPYAQLCCYNKAGHLLCGSPHGGTHLVRHPRNTGSHFIKDVRPKKTCCKQTNYDPDICGLFYKCRRNNCGNGYIPPHVSNSHGDPHYTTFDGLHYDFQGVGEYWMMKTIGDNIAVQVRQTQGPHPWNPSVSFFHGLVMNCHNERFQIEVDTHNKSMPVYMHYNGQPYPFMPGVPCVDLGNHGLTVCQHLSAHSNQEVSLKITCDEVVAKVDVWVLGSSTQHLFKFMNIQVYFDGNHMGILRNVTGLMGNNNGDPKDDFIPPGGTKPALPHNAPWSEVHSKFGELWRVDEYESDFVYQPGKSYHTYNNVPKKFKPAAEKPSPARFPKEVQRVCGDNIDCYVEYKQSNGSMAMAKAALREAKKMEQIKHDMFDPDKN